MLSTGRRWTRGRALGMSRNACSASGRVALALGHHSDLTRMVGSEKPAGTEGPECQVPLPSPCAPPHAAHSHRPVTPELACAL